MLVGNNLVEQSIKMLCYNLGGITVPATLTDNFCQVTVEPNIKFSHYLELMESQFCQCLEIHRTALKHSPKELKKLGP